MQTSSEDTEAHTPAPPVTPPPEKADTSVPDRPARRTRQAGIPARPAIVATVNTTATAAAGLHQAAGMPGLAIGAAAGSAALLAAVMRGRRSGRRSARRSAWRATVNAGRSGKRGTVGGATGGSRRGRRGGSRSGPGGVAPRKSGATKSPATGGKRKPATGATSSGSAKRHGSKRSADTGPATTDGSRRKQRRPTGGRQRAGRKGAGSNGRRSLLGWVGDKVRHGRHGARGGTTKNSGTSTPQQRRGAIHRAATAIRHPLRTANQAARRLNERRRHGAPRRAEARKRLAKATGHGLLAGLAGAAVGICRLSARRGWATARRVWANRRAKQRATGETTPTVADTVRDPKTSSTTKKAPPRRAATQGAPMASRFVEAAAEMAGAASAYSPTGMVQVGNDLARVPEALQHVADALRITVQQAHSQFPIHPQIVELLGGVFQQIQQAATTAQDIGPAFQSMHRVDLERHENPRVGEQMWDVSANR